MGDARQDDLGEVAQHVGERLGFVGRAGRQRGADLTGLDAGEHRQLSDPLEVVRSPVDGSVAVGAQVDQRPWGGRDRIRVHVAGGVSVRAGHTGSSLTV